MSNNNKKFCPNCKNNPYLSIELNYIVIQCNCGYNEKMNVDDYLNVLLDNGITHSNSKMKNNNEFSNNILNTIGEAYSHLENYFSNIRDNHIKALRKQLNDIESTYEESYNRNINLLYFLKVLIDNYDGSKIMKHNIINNSNINIYTCQNQTNIEEIINYYREYQIVKYKPIEKHNKDFSFSLVKTIKEQTVYELHLLNDNRIATCSNDKKIRIYNPNKDYTCEETFQRHKDVISSICQLDDGTIVSCSFDKSIIIGNHTIYDAHDGCINKVIALPNKLIATCSDDRTIKIWKSNPPYFDKPIKTLDNHYDVVLSIIYIKEKIY